MNYFIIILKVLGFILVLSMLVTIDKDIKNNISILQPRVITQQIPIIKIKTGTNLSDLEKVLNTQSSGKIYSIEFADKKLESIVINTNLNAIEVQDIFTYIEVKNKVIILPTNDTTPDNNVQAFYIEYNKR